MPGAIPGATPIHDLIRSHDWSASPLGAPAGWPASLRALVTMMLESTIPMSVVWGERRVLLYNQPYVLFLGDKHPGAAFGLPISQVWPEIWDVIGPLVERAACGEAFYLEDVALRLNRAGQDEQAWFTFSYSPVRDDDGRLNGMCSAVLETTSRVQGERRQAFLLSLATTLGKLDDPATIMQTAARLAAGFLEADRVKFGELDVAADSIEFFAGSDDVDGRHALSGYGEGHALRLARGDVVAIEDIEADPTADAAVRANYAQLGARSVVAVPLARPDKAMSALLVSHGAPRRWQPDAIALMREIGEYTWNAVERARAEQALRRLTATLEERVAERTAALEDMTAVLRDKDRHKDQFLAMLAHELRNPLAPISAAAELLGMQGLPAAQLARTGDVIRRQARHMVGMIDDLLDVSRVTTGQIVLERRDVALAEIVGEALEQVRPHIDTRGHACEVALPAAPVLLHADAKRLVQVLANVLGNAAKYTPPGGRIVLQASAAGGELALRVGDNGIGIAPDVLPYVFDLFVQGERSSDRAQGGLGIGLALVRSLVALHGGAVSVDSAGRDRGTWVTIRLPCAAAPAQSAAGPAAALAAAPQPANSARRVLVVDDNADAGELLGLLLGEAGYDVSVDDQPLRALARSGRERFDIFVLDIGMPLLDGLELTRRLRRQPSSAQALIVAVSGYGSDEARSDAMNAGFDAYLTKPVDLASLVALLDARGAPPAHRPH